LNGLKQAIKQKARQLGFTLAGVTSSEPLSHHDIFESWLNAGMHGTMGYLAEARSRARRADPKEILPECRSILVLGIPYAAPVDGPIASYALGTDYHDVLPERLRAIVNFIEEQVGHPVPNRCYTDTGPLLERELAQRAGLGWVGRNTCLINPGTGSTFFLAEILLGIELEPDAPFKTDHCGTCTRCIDACPTKCILPDRTLDARRCISYLTIELKEDIPQDLRPLMKDWVFGCDICQQVCPWNRFSLPADPAFEPLISLPVLTSDLLLTPREFNQRFRHSPLKRPKRRGYLRNIAVATGNHGNRNDIPVLEKALEDSEPLVKEHAKWAIDRIRKREDEESIVDRHQ
jgi:epoxyqueuosine reductase